MPHIAIDYTANLTDDLHPLELPRKLHEAAISLGVFPLNGLRTFARAIDQHHVGADTRNEGFVNIQIRIAPGRPEELRQRIVDTLFATAEQTLAALIDKRPVGLQLEITELDRSLTRMAGSLPSA
ncbi:5-carboxymethyl-2-hydroxymuconate Delta-isomerase [Pseudomonas nicosulfuronedens]|uniref:5-carboxymethyl-2-hydroxymuconate Delta-isomerase n=1 Tax=Pseudomonas nicosulfuronedens TaxID=2571105 RepID=A0A5R9R9Q0_9PSED|nr:5-carboxymethyl-2-hydroxymuconate Delta-isomerase [Pseudomonas nicosulfuronedens]MDH1007477.1 5-carboxymethyl-2-hydroxymuconate Delta-isomerase [Pseudomonas nicosulfuronedens]MDH1977523.1 5-carboxymethyl-2-hydroxymuconate Delta-isomerase [Pseudomonas nicosulfuronedens]MDH2028951.1 5-carboxymethyl-2-hydroxymuconate Delta-isomerase [Pseudomonas nicosulfuronedens]TLX79779.1 5-carboxymethyl-2-hydroxymuconate Delta-isomerase [Pseudomonas nicosulfuronedens]